MDELPEWRRRWVKNAPSPGSQDARDRGCVCPVMDNAYGRGYLGGMKDEQGNVVFAIVVGCPQHYPSGAANG